MEGHRGIFEIQDRVVVSAEYQEQRNLQGRRGTITAVPDEDHLGRYRVVLDAGFFSLFVFSGKEVWIAEMSLRRT